MGGRSKNLNDHVGSLVKLNICFCRIERLSAWTRLSTSSDVSVNVPRKRRVRFLRNTHEKHRGEPSATAGTCLATGLAGGIAG